MQKFLVYIEPPEAPRNLAVSATSAYAITARWTPPAELGGRDDLFYKAEHSDPDNLGSFTGTVYKNEGDTSHTFTGLTPYTQYCVRVTAHNGVSDQDPDGTHLRTVEECTETPEASEYCNLAHMADYMYIGVFSTCVTPYVCIANWTQNGMTLLSPLYTKAVSCLCKARASDSSG